MRVLVLFIHYILIEFLALDTVKHRTFLAPRPASASSSSSQASHTTSSSKPANIPPIEPPEDTHQFYLPTPRASSDPPPEEMDDADLPDEAPRANPEEAEGAAGGRERRTRKSVNYAEPKLNTYVVDLNSLAQSI